MFETILDVYRSSVMQFTMGYSWKLANCFDLVIYILQYFKSLLIAKLSHARILQLCEGVAIATRRTLGCMKRQLLGVIT